MGFMYASYLQLGLSGDFLFLFLLNLQQVVTSDKGGNLRYFGWHLAQKARLTLHKALFLATSW